MDLDLLWGRARDTNQYDTLFSWTDRLYITAEKLTEQLFHLHFIASRLGLSF